jgi:hypothetical protein
MTIRPIHAALSAVLSAGLALSVGASGAQADARSGSTRDPVTCTIGDVFPPGIILGVTARTVKFAVGTYCGPDHPANWQLTSDIYPGSSGASWLMLRNFHHPGGEKFTYVENPDGFYHVNFTGDQYFDGNWMAGPHPYFAVAFYDANQNGQDDGDEPLTRFNGSFVAKRATTFGTTFQASPDRLRRGQTLKISGSLQRANWDTGVYDGFAGTVSLQFRAAGHSSWKTVKHVRDDGTSAATTAKATVSGYWRYHYSGDAVSGSSNSAIDKVTVT